MSETCGCYPTIQPFVFNTVGIQNAANSIYAGVSTGAGTSGVKRFKSDYERMQYLVGKRAIDKSCCTLATNCAATN